MFNLSGTGMRQSKYCSVPCTFNRTRGAAKTAYRARTMQMPGRSTPLLRIPPSEPRRLSEKPTITSVDQKHRLHSKSSLTLSHRCINFTLNRNRSKNICRGFGIIPANLLRLEEHHRQPLPVRGHKLKRRLSHTATACNSIILIHVPEFSAFAAPLKRPSPWLN